MAQLNAPERVRRILSIVPWIAERDGPTLDEITDRFAVDRKDLLADLEVVFMVGVPPYTPDMLIDVRVEDDRVWIDLGHYFRRPLRLTPAEALRVLVAGRAALEAPGADPAGALGRALAKLSTALGPVADTSVDVSLGPAPPATLSVLRDALGTRRQVELDYYSYGRDDHSVRVVDPFRLDHREGNWYLTGWCHMAGGERIFRVDRIDRAQLLDTEVRHIEDGADGTFHPGDDAPRVHLRLAPAARWVAEQYPNEGVRHDGEEFAVVLAVTAESWLTRLLLRLGPDATVERVEVPGDAAASDRARRRLEDAMNAAAGALLRRYRS